jgi:hypothetical protein
MRLSCIRLQERVPANHPLHAVRALVDAALADLPLDVVVWHLTVFKRNGDWSIAAEVAPGGLATLTGLARRAQLDAT